MTPSTATLTCATTASLSSAQYILQVLASLAILSCSCASQPHAIRTP
jgi:hypothetical protein